jgi:hypothetical protein
MTSFDIKVILHHRLGEKLDLQDISRTISDKERTRRREDLVHGKDLKQL